MSEMKRITVLVCGGRDYEERDKVFGELDRLCGPVDDNNLLGDTIVTVIHGDCPTGADRLADQWAVVNRSPCKPYPAAWGIHGRKAGPMRNQQMLDEGKPDLVLAFPGGMGTADMVRRARAAGVPVTEVPA